MDKQKQIEEMAELICDNNNDGICATDGWICNHNCDYCNSARVLYSEGYRKQSEGKWKKTCVPDVFQCTNCKRPTKMDELCDSEMLREYCPNCGAKMKGE